mmetsp:Transcript_6314/g.16924  ORF Transcript_6314/g.16924 Transcript_6314/m.16924 type:complete len:556 (+) Transcript_6314:218-1885(+)
MARAGEGARSGGRQPPRPPAGRGGRSGSASRSGTPAPALTKAPAERQCPTSAGPRAGPGAGSERRPAPGSGLGGCRVVLRLSQQPLDLPDILLEGANHFHEPHPLVQQHDVDVLVLRGLVVAHASQEAQLVLQQVALPVHHLAVEAQRCVELAHALEHAPPLLELPAHRRAALVGVRAVRFAAATLPGTGAGCALGGGLALGVLDDLVELAPQDLELLLRLQQRGLLALRHAVEGLLGLGLRAGPGLQVLHGQLQLAAVPVRRVCRAEVEGLDPEQQRRGELAVRGELEPPSEVLAHLGLGDLVEADGALPAGLNQLLLREAVDALPEVVTVLPPKVGDVVPELDLEVPRPPGVGLGEAEHPRERLELLRAHVPEGQLLIEELAEPQDLLEARVLLGLHELLLELLQLRGLVRELAVGLRELLGALEHHLLPELCHLLLRLQLPRKRCIVVLLLEEGRGQHTRKEAQEEGQQDLRKGHDNEEGEGDEFQAVRCCAHEQLLLADRQRVAFHNTLHQVEGCPHVSTEEPEASGHPATKVHHGIPDIFVPFLDYARIT